MIRKADASELIDTIRKLEIVQARLAVSLAILNALVQYAARIGGYMTHEDQQIIRAARALLAECEAWSKP